MDGIQVVTYLLVFIFVIAFMAKVMKMVRMPKHLRWELYPLAGETKRPWGGSYLEDKDWWIKPPEHKSLIHELKFMGEEILFFKEYFHRNRSLWYIVYPFHIGVFLFVAFAALLIVGALTMVAEMPVSGGDTGAWGILIYYLTLVVGIGALVFGAIGCLALLIRKLSDKVMSPYTRRIEYFNIIVVLVVFLTGISAWAVADRSFDIARGYMRSLVALGDMGSLDAIITAHIVLLALLLAYLPFTNIMHFFAKFFTYHMVRWDDAPNLRGSRLERSLKPLLDQRINWAAPHMQTLNKWSDIATEDGKGVSSGRLSRKAGN